MNSKTFFTASIVALLTVTTTFAHGGRRFDVVVIENQIFAQGYNSGDSTDGAPRIRPYLNAIHTHWAPGVGTGAIDLPGFDVFQSDTVEVQGENFTYSYENDANLLSGFDLNLQLVGAGKWDNPGDGAIDLGSLDGEVLGFGTAVGLLTSETIGSDSPQLTLIAANDWADPTDIDPDYSIDTDPTSALYFLQFQLSSSNPLIQNSDPISVVFAPNGQFHPQALQLESALGTSAVPEPASVSLLAIGGLGLFLRRRRS